MTNTEEYQSDLLVIFNMKDEVAKRAVIEVIKRIWEHEESQKISSLEITPEYLEWIQREFYPEAAN